MAEKSSEKKRRHLTKEEQREIANTLHWAVINEMLKASDWDCDNIAFQGGTSLHFVWKSPRFSDDLDFLLDRNLADELPKIMKKVQKKIQEYFSSRWPGCDIEVRDKTREGNKLSWFQFSFANEKTYFEKVHTKVEFWKVSPEILKQYGNTLRHVNMPQTFAHVVTLAIPAAEREWIYHDKIHAIADRGFVKWRDVFDLWWLRTQSESETGVGLRKPTDHADFMAKSAVVNAMYDSTPEGMVPGLRKFIDIPDVDLIKKAQDEMYKYLPDEIWKRMWPGQFDEIITFVKSELTHIAKLIENNEPILVKPENKTRPARKKPAKTAAPSPV